MGKMRWVADSVRDHCKRMLVHQMNVLKDPSWHMLFALGKYMRIFLKKQRGFAKMIKWRLLMSLLCS
jgi:hypothetical protein